MFTGRKLPLTLAFVVLIGLAFGASCKGFFVDPVLTTVAVGPKDQNVEVNDTLQMSARGTYDDGSTKNITGSVSWSTSNGDVATIDKGGLVQGVTAPGEVTITASQDTVSGTATVNVVLTGVTAVVVAPENVGAHPGDSVDFTCMAKVNGKADVDITSVAVWTTSDETNTSLDTGSSPAVLTIESGLTQEETVTVTCSYTVGTTTFKDTGTVDITIP